MLIRRGAFFCRTQKNFTFPYSVLLSLVLLLLLSNGMPSATADEDTTAATHARIQQALSALGEGGTSGPTPTSITPSAVPSLYTVIIGTDVGYITADGRYLIRGEMMDLQAQTNLTALEFKKIAHKAVMSMDPAEFISFTPEKPDYTVVVFTDIDCSYCRRLHSQITEYNKLGIAIRYAAFPRAGLDSDSYHKAVTVWCSTDRTTAMTHAKTGALLEAKTCTNPVADHLRLAEKLRFEGTPTLVLADGTVLPGYLPPTELAARVRNIAAATSSPNASSSLTP